MCDTLGRKFSYACPNTTLFQQRMLVCDHWFMVNCSKSEQDFSANLLIGQRDKPFVGAEENVQRTPRPDLKDRPYAADYSGESFRRHYQVRCIIVIIIAKYWPHFFFFQSLQHHIQLPEGSAPTDAPEYVPIHWETSNKRDTENQAINRAPTQATAESQNNINGLRRFQTPAGFSKPEIIKSLDVTGNVQIPSSISELPNQHADYSSTEIPRTHAPVTLPTISTRIHLSPSAFAKAFEANPLQFKSKEHNEVSKPFKTRDPEAIVVQQTTTTIRVIETPTTQPPPPTTPPPQTTSTTTQPVSTSTYASPIPLIDESHLRRPTNVIPEPIDGLQPPHLHYKTYDDSTTEGPPIYYQWKWSVPAFVLEPPTFNEPETKGEFIEEEIFFSIE